MSRFLLLCTTVMLWGVSTTCSPGDSPDAAPNIILIVADDLGYGDLGSYGQRLIQTPRLDRLAAEGMRFTDVYAGSTVCAPSRSVLMTGIHTGRNEIRGNREYQPMGQHPLRDETVTVAEVLREAGYTTALIGKWGLGYPGSSGVPSKQGFDYFFGYLGQRHAHNYYPEFLFRNDERVPIMGNRVAIPRADGAGVAVDRAQYSHDLFVAEALTFITRHADAPFFLYLALTIPHANNEAGRSGMEVPDYGPYEDVDWPEPQKGLAAMITRMDADIGRIIDLLEERGIDDRTVVFFTSDNGPHAEGGNDPAFFDSNGPLRGIKRDLFDGGIRVPMIVRWPGHTPPGTVSDHVGYSGDFIATAAELAGTVPPDEIQSISFLPTIVGEPGRQLEHDYLYWEFYPKGSAQAVRWGRWKALRQPIFTGAIELYDLAEDIGETDNVAALRPGLVETARRMMDDAHRPSPLFTVQAFNPVGIRAPWVPTIEDQGDID
ncbi:MAG: arylsulfatase [Gemmatimonadales bacterium]|jgi:uncharacterized sulfatase